MGNGVSALSGRKAALPTLKLLITTERSHQMSLLENPMHPGDVLKELYLHPLDISPIAFARRLKVPRTRVERLIKGTTSVTPDTALRLARALGTTPAYWMNMQTAYDMDAASKEIDVSAIEPLVAA
jgi:addiction module HigA family antidote